MLVWTTVVFVVLPAAVHITSTHHIYTSRHISTTKELKCCKTQTHVLCCVLCFQRTACRFSSPHWCYSRCQQRCRRSSQSCSESSPESGRDRTQHAESEPTSSRSQRQKQQVDWLMKFTYLLLTDKSTMTKPLQLCGQQSPLVAKYCNSSSSSSNMVITKYLHNSCKL